MNIASYVIALIAAIISMTQSGCVALLGQVATELGAGEEVKTLAGAGGLIFIAGVVAIIGSILSKKRKSSGWKTITAAAVLCAFAGMSGFPDGWMWAVVYLIAAVFGFFAINKLNKDKLQAVFDPVTNDPTINKSTYVLRKYLIHLGCWLLTWTLVCVVFSLYNNNHLSDFIDAQTPLLDVFRYYVFIMPLILIDIAPTSLFLAGYSLWYLKKNNELTAIRANGISFYRITVPIVIVGIVFSLVIGVLQETVAPRSTYWAWQFINQQKKGGDLSMRYASDLPYKNEDQRRIWLINKFDLASGDMQGVKVVQQRADGSDLEVIRAEEAKYFDGNWWLFNVNIQKYDFYNNPIGAPTHEPLRRMAEWNEPREVFMHEVTNMEFLSARDLWRFLVPRENLSDKTRARTRARILVDIHARLAMPWTCLVFTILGVASGLYTARKGAFLGIILGIVIALLTVISFYILMAFGQWLGTNQLLNPIASVWIPTMIGLIIGLYCMARLKQAYRIVR